MNGIHRLMNVALLLWGGVFCLIAAFCLFLGKNYNKERRKWLLCMQFCTSMLMFSDALAWIFRGNISTLGYYMVRISNFLVFLLTDQILFFFQQYVGCRLFEGERLKNRRIRDASVICVVAMGLVVISQFTDLYYYFDANNLYHRNSAYILSTILPLICTMMDLSLLIQYRKKTSPELLMAMGSYIVLPMMAAIVQSVHYGAPLINIAIGCSMILMYIVATGEQNKETGRLAKSREEITEKLQIASTLNRCVKELSSVPDVDRAIYNLLSIINEYFDADRSYIFEIDFEKNVMVNTYEFVRGRVTAQKDNLQEVPVEVISVWMENFRKSQLYFISDLEKERGTAYYDLLRAQDIHRLLAVPLMKDHEIIGFLGVDNPNSHYEDATLLGSLQFFITSSLERKKEEEYLKYLSYRDKLTELYNRNRYIELLNEKKGQKLFRTGVAYLDLNGLKKMNDQYGHEAGDRLIRNAAAALREVFADQTYRVGGDEFVIVALEMEEQTFADGMQQLRERLKQSDVSVSVGFIWKAETDDLEALLKDADVRMYREKKSYYRTEEEELG